MRERYLRVGLLTTVALACAAILGCQSKGPETGNVSGQVTFNSQPVTAGTVVFENPSQAWIGAGELDSSGHFRILKIRTGDYVVSVQPPAPRIRSESDASLDAIKAGLGTPKASDPANIPRSVRSTQTSPLKATVVAGDQELGFELSKLPGS